MKLYTVFLVSLFLAVHSYNETEAKLQAKLSAISYCSNNQIQFWNCTLCKSISTLQHVSVLESTATGMKGFIGYDSSSDTIYISWRGAEDNLKWIKNMNYSMMDYQGSFRCGNCKINKQLFDTNYTLWSTTKGKVEEIVKLLPGSKISVTGHGLGGAFAIIGSVFLYKEYPARVSDIYTFGSLRVGNAMFSRWLESDIPEIYRIVHNKDLVPHLPPLEYEYFHSSVEILYDQPMRNYVECEAVGEDPNCSNKFNPDYNTEDNGGYWFDFSQRSC